MSASLPTPSQVRRLCTALRALHRAEQCLTRIRCNRALKDRVAMGFSLHERGYRDGFYGREPRESDPVYLDGYHAGLRDGDRTRPLARSAAGIAENASSATLGLVSDSSGVTGSDEASLTSDTPAETTQ